GVAACINHVEIFAEGGIDGDHGAGFVVAVGEEAALGIEHHEGFAVAHDLDGGALGLIVGAGARFKFLAEEAVGPDAHLVAGVHGALDVAVEGGAGESDEDEDDAEMDHVAAVAAGVAHGEFDGGGKHVHSCAGADDHGAAEELAENGEGDEDAEDEAGQGVEVAETERKRHGARERAPGKGPAEIAAQAVERGAAPGEQGADAGEKQQEEADGNVYFVEEGRADADFISRKGLGDDREERAPENGEASGQQDQIVEEEVGFAGDHGIELVVALQVVAILQIGDHAHGQNKDEEAGEPLADGRLREGVHGADYAAAGEESAEDAEHEGDEDQPDVPDAHHAALFLHHHGMQESGAGDPGHERSVLNRIPSPVAAPAEHGVGPMGAEKDADGLESPGDHGPAAGDVNPFLAGITAEEGGEG